MFGSFHPNTYLIWYRVIIFHFLGGIENWNKRFEKKAPKQNSSHTKKKNNSLDPQKVGAQK